MNFNIIICAYNEKKNLRDLIPYLIKSRYTNNLKEILVVSSGSDDGTDELILDYVKKFNTPQKSILKLISEPEKRGKFSAINIALKNCKKADVLIFLSADVFPARGSINNLVELFKEPNVGCATGRSVPRNLSNSLISRLGVVAWRLQNIIMNEDYKAGKLTYAAGDMMAFKYGIFEKIPKIILDDAWMALQTHKRGYKVLYDPKIIVYIQSPAKINDWITQRVRNKRGHYQLLKLGFQPQVLAFMSIRNRIKFMIRDILAEKSLIPIIILMLIELYIKFKSRDERSAIENWIRISSTKEGFRS